MLPLVRWWDFRLSWSGILLINSHGRRPWEACQEWWRSGLLLHTSCTCRTTGVPGSKASSSSSLLVWSSQFWLWLPSSPSSLSPSHRSKLQLTQGASTSPVCGASWLSNGPSSWPCTRTDTARSLQTSASSAISSQYWFYRLRWTLRGLGCQQELVKELLQQRGGKADMSRLKSHLTFNTWSCTCCTCLTSSVFVL